MERLRPDIILLEWDSPYFNEKRLRRQYCLVMPQYEFYPKANNLEILAATKYSKNHDEVILGPFEWKETARLYKETQGKLRSKMMRALYNTKSDTVYKVIKEYSKLSFYTKSLPRIENFNTNKNDSLMQRYIYLEYEVIPNLVLNNDSLSQNHDHARKFKDYWPTRNFHMGNNILNVVRYNPGKRIAVLTGFRHRYLLHKLLSKKVISYNFKLLDFKAKELSK